MKRICYLMLVMILIVSMMGCEEEVKEKSELLFYIGITMVKPVSELADNFEQEHNCDIHIVQGGSQDLYNSLKNSGVGDLYLPGSYSYRKNNLEDGLLLDAVLVGYNRAALMVKEGNPLDFQSDLEILADSDTRVVLCNPESGSIGTESKRVLEANGNYKEVFDNAIYLTTDSRNLTDAIVTGDADICINWYATTVWEENVDEVDAIVIDESLAAKKMLIMSLLKSSTQQDLTREFLAYASSEEGRAIFEKYGFLDEVDLEMIDEVEFE